MADRLQRVIHDLSVGVNAWHKNDASQLNRRQMLFGTGAAIVESTAAIGGTIALLRSDLIGRVLHRVVIDPWDWAGARMEDLGSQLDKVEILVPDQVRFEQLTKNPESFIGRNEAGMNIEDGVAHYIGSMPIQDNYMDIFLIYSRNDLGRFIPGETKALIGMTYNSSDLPPKIPYYQDLPTDTNPQLNPDFPHPILRGDRVGIYDISHTAVKMNYAMDPYSKDKDTESGREESGIEDAVKHEWDNPQFNPSVYLSF